MKLIPKKSFLYLPSLGVIFLTCIVLLTVTLHSFVFSKAQFGTDFYSVWMAGRAAILDHQDPYSDKVNQAIQMGVYRRLAHPGEDQLKFAYPVHSLLLVLPTLWMDLPWALASWMAINISLLLTLPFFTYREIPRWMVISLIFVPAFSFALLMGNLSVSVGVSILVACGLITMRRNWLWGSQILSGVLLAWGTVKPQLVWLVILFMLIYALRYKLWGVWWGFFGAGICLLILSWGWAPGWPLHWLSRVSDYTTYAGVPPLAYRYAQLFFPQSWSIWIGSGLLIGCGILSGVLLYKWWGGKFSTVKMLAWCSFFTYLINPSSNATYQQIILIIPIFFWASQPTPQAQAKRILVWLLTLGFSWLIFLLDLIKVFPFQLDKIPLLLFVIWMVWLQDQTNSAEQLPHQGSIAA